MWLLFCLLFFVLKKRTREKAIKDEWRKNRKASLQVYSTQPYRPCQEGDLTGVDLGGSWRTSSGERPELVYVEDCFVSVQKLECRELRAEVDNTYRSSCYTPMGLT